MPVLVMVGVSSDSFAVSLKQQKEIKDVLLLVGNRKSVSFVILNSIYSHVIRSL